MFSTALTISYPGLKLDCFWLWDLATAHVTQGLDLDLRRTCRISKTLLANPALTSFTPRLVANGMVKG